MMKTISGEMASTGPYANISEGIYKINVYCFLASVNTFIAAPISIVFHLTVILLRAAASPCRCMALFGNGAYAEDTAFVVRRGIEPVIVFLAGPETSMKR
jgi:hypothetical protein